MFVKTKHNAKKLAKNLEKEGFESDSLHGNLRQNKRNQVIAKFRANKIHVLVATDIAARGLDIPHIEHVVNFDLPQQAEDFIHRMGRTGRAGASGTAWSFVTPSDKRKWHEIEKILNPGLKSSSDSKRSGGRRDDYSKKRPFKRGGLEMGFVLIKVENLVFAIRKKLALEEMIKKKLALKKVIKEISQAENQLNLGLKEKNQNQKMQGMEEKHLLAIDLKEEMALAIEKIEPLLLNPDRIVTRVLQKKASQTFLRNEKKAVVFTIERKLALKNQKVNLLEKKKVLLIENQRVENPSVLAKRVDLNPVAKNLSKKNFSLTLNS